MNPSALLDVIRATVPDAVHRYTHGDCYRLHLLLKAVFPDAAPWYDRHAGHVLTAILGRLWDINGERWAVGHVPEYVVPWADLEDWIKADAPNWKWTPSQGVVDEAIVERECETVARRDGIDWNNAEWQATHKIEAGRLRTRISAALQAAALPAVPEVESVTLTVAQIADLASFAGLILAKSPQPAPDELEAEITVCACPDKGVLLDGEDADPGAVAHYKHIAYYSEYPDEGCIGLGPELTATPPAEPA